MMVQNIGKLQGNRYPDVCVIITLISPLLIGMVTLLNGQDDPDPARFAKSPDGDEVYI